MYDLIVIGGGFWGTAAAVQAREAGLDTLLLDDNNPQGASRNAAGIMSLNWYKFQRKTRIYTPTITNLMAGLFSYADAAWGVQWYVERGLAHFTGEHYLSAKGQPQFRKDCFLLNSPAEALALGQAERGRAVKLVKGRGYRVVLTEARELLARRVILTAGAFTDALLEQSNLPTVGVSALRGRALVYQTDRVFPTPLTYKASVGQQYTLRQWGTRQVRLGDTTERGETSNALDKMRAFAATELQPLNEIQVLDGLRPITDKMIVQAIKPGLVVATGGHRVGLALAPSAARKALELLGVDHGKR